MDPGTNSPLMQRSIASCILLALVVLSLVQPLYSQTADSFSPNPNGMVCALAVQPDGKILLGGFFTGYIGGQQQNYIGRVASDGSPDTSFVTGADWFVNALVLQPDGAIVVGGGFGSLGGQSRSHLGRLNSNGTVDLSFNPGADGPVECLALQADGKILVGGFFGHLGGQTRTCLGRLNSDGSLDTAFNPGTGWGVTSLLPQPDGKILVGGWFSSLAGTNRNYLGRLNSDGSLDVAFNPGADNFVNCLALQADRKILVGGLFTNLAGQVRSHIGRLNADGSLDTAFNPGANDEVYSLVVQADASILVGGYFTTLGGQTRNYIGRLNSNGSLDATFNPGAGGSVVSLAIQADGKVFVGGGFSSLAGTNRSEVGRLNNTAAGTQDLSYSSSKITWHRGGTGPEVWRTSFDVSTNGTTWNNVGSGVRISGGWQLTGVSLPASATIRARGLIQDALYSGSSWFVETNIGPLAISQQPLSRTNIAGTLASFSIQAVGGSGPSYRWRKGGKDLSDGPNISGTTTATLVLNNVFGPDAGAYSVVVNDAHTSLTSQVATLVVLDPYISTQPLSLTNNALTTATFTVTAAGQASLAYSWLKNGTNLSDTANLSGSHSNTLTLNSVLGSDAGGYSVVVSDAFASATSLVASLTVIDPIITSQPVTQAASAGQSATLSVSIIASLPIFQWRQGGAPLAGATSASLTFTNLQATNAGFYDVIVSNAYGVLTSAVAILTVNFATADSLNPGIIGQINALAVQPDGKIVIGGSFNTGQFGPSRYNFARLNADGTIDVDAFDLGASGAVKAIAINTNGTVILGGAFTSVGGHTHNRLA